LSQTGHARVADIAEQAGIACGLVYHESQMLDVLLDGLTPRNPPNPGG
jgi:hypothetical protein